MNAATSEHTGLRSRLRLFVLVGIVATVVDIGVLLRLAPANGVVVADVAGLVLAALVAYVGNRVITFRGAPRARWVRNPGLFAATALVAGGVDVGITWAFEAQGLRLLIAKLLALPAAAAIRWGVYRWILFNEVRRDLAQRVDRGPDPGAVRLSVVIPASNEAGRIGATVDRLLAELVPGAVKKDLTAPQAKQALASVRPRDIAGKTRRRVAADELADLVTVEKKVKELTRQIQAIVTERGSHLTDLYGVGPVVAGRILADVGDVARFADRNRFASWTGTAPLDASSGEHTRHRLSRAGNRRVNHMLHIAATTQIRNDTAGRAYYRRKLAAGKTPMEAMRCLKRRISDAVYRQLIADAQAADIATESESPEQRLDDDGAGSGGQSGASEESSAADLHTPVIGSSDQPQPEPAAPRLPARRSSPTPHAASASQPPRRRAGAVKVQRPTGRTTLTATSAGAHSTVPKLRS